MIQPGPLKLDLAGAACSVERPRRARKRPKFMLAQHGTARTSSIVDPKTFWHDSAIQLEIDPKSSLRSMLLPGLVRNRPKIVLVQHDSVEHANPEGWRYWKN